MNVVFGFVGISDFPAEVLVVRFDLADAGAGARWVLGVCDRRKLDFILVLVPIRSYVPRGPEESEEMKEE